MGFSCYFELSKVEGSDQGLFLIVSQNNGGVYKHLFFTPEFNISITDIVKHDLPIILTSVSFDDTWSGDFSDFRVITWTLSFQAKTYLEQKKKGELYNQNSIILKAILKK